MDKRWLNGISNRYIHKFLYLFSRRSGWIRVLTVQLSLLDIFQYPFDFFCWCSFCKNCVSGGFELCIVQCIRTETGEINAFTLHHWIPLFFFFLQFRINNWNEMHTEHLCTDFSSIIYLFYDLSCFIFCFCKHFTEVSTEWSNRDFEIEHELKRSINFSAVHW